MLQAEKKCFSHALRILSRRRQTRAQLKEKLLKKEYDQEVIEAVLVKCESYKYLNDLEFAGLWVQNRNQFKPMGKWRLRQEMLQKGISEEIIDTALQEFLPVETEEQLLKQLLLNKFNLNTSYQDKPVRLLNFLLRRGFSKAQIFKVAQNEGIDIWKYKQT